MVEAGCGRCGAVMVMVRETSKTEKFECPNCGRRIVVRKEGVWQKMSEEEKKIHQEIRRKLDNEYERSETWGFDAYA